MSGRLGLRAAAERLKADYSDVLAADRAGDSERLDVARIEYARSRILGDRVEDPQLALDVVGG